MKFLICFLCFISANSHAVIHEKVIICGVSRDVGTRLPHTINIMEKIGSLFDDYKIIVYENNSNDDTPLLLKNWKNCNPKVFVKSENIMDSDFDSVVINRLNDHQIFRPELISRARNIVLDIAMSDSYKDYTYLIWMDMDFKVPPSYRGIIETFKTDREWDAVLAYGIDPDEIYWDWYAFRDAVYPIGSELLGNTWWYMPKTFSLNTSSDWYPVYSAFGGCGIYKKSSIQGCRYSATVTEDLEYCAKEIIEQGKQIGHPQIMLYLDMLNQITSILEISSPKPGLPLILDPSVGIILHSESDPLVWRMSSFVYQYPSTCEHVPFHASMIRRGHGKIFINPRLIFHYGD